MTAGSRLLVNSGTNTFAGLITNSGANAGGGISVSAGAILTANGGVTNNTGATIVNNGFVGNTGTVNNFGTWTGTVSTSGTFNNNGTGTVSGLLTNTAGTATNAGQLNGGVAVSGGTVTNTNIVANGVTVSATGAYTQNAGTTNGGLTNGNNVDANGGAINGTIVNNAGVFNVGGNVTSNGTFTNNGTATFALGLGNYSGLTALTNNSTSATAVVVSTGRLLTVTGAIANNAGTYINNGTTTAASTSNASGATFNNNATGTLNSTLNNDGSTNNAGTINGLATNTGNGTLTTTGTLANGLTNTGVVNAQGTINGPIANNAGGINVTGALVGNSTFTNAAAAAMNINGQSFTGSTTYINSGFTNLITAGILSATSITNNGTFLNSGTTTGTFTMAAGNLSGTGNTQSLTVNGGTFAPGNGTAGSSMTITGNMVLQAAATYLVQVDPTTASFTNVTGAATLNGATVSANFAAGSYVSKRYTIVTAAGGRTGTFGALVTTGQPASVTSTLSYDANNAYLDLNLAFGLPGSLDQNQQNVGNALTGFFNRTGGIPAVFASLTPAQLTQADGEAATSSQQSTFNAMNQFMGVMTDPFIAGRGDPLSAGGSATGYADERATKRNPNDALAAIYRKAPLAADPFAQRWSVWAAGYGGSQTTNGNAVQGSSNSSSNLYGTAVGADYRLSPNTQAGFALAGGGTNFSVANGLGSGRSDLFQAGAFVRHNMGAAYLSGALAYGWQDVTTNRTLTIAGIDQLQAKFNANAWSGRIEGGYRFVTQGLGWTPYAAGQFTTFDLPAYAEQVISGANTFALVYGDRSVTATRSELGLRTDKSFAMEDGVFTLRGRAAWAHDYNPDRAIGATFQTLPGASFVVNGARQASDAALVTASAEKKWLNGWSAAGTFEGEFSSVTTSYAGKGVVRYAW
ncbi:MAG: autotransporter domain-containing protein [Xanthobacteraceae bacterium]|nr:autotransporter domain-containing protein [Xanthobacteraceae bacterium]